MAAGSCNEATNPLLSVRGEPVLKHYMILYNAQHRLLAIVNVH